MLKNLFKNSYQYRFDYLLFSLLVVFPINIFFPDSLEGGPGQIFYMLVQFVAGLNLFKYHRQELFRTVGIIMASIIILKILNITQRLDLERYFIYVYILFFGVIVAQVFRQMATAQIVSRRIVVAAICGFLLLGYVSYFIYAAIEYVHPNSFAGIDVVANGYRDLFYFSYVTLMTIGYGDILPVTWLAKNATIICAMSGYIYSLVVVATIVGRFTSKK